MKLTISKPVTLDIKDALSKSTATLNRLVREFCGDYPTQNEVDVVLKRLREIRMLIHNDADATRRMADMAPEQAKHYANIWALCTDKLIHEATLLLSGLHHGDCQITEDDTLSGDELDAWGTPPTAQVESPTELEGGDPE